MKKFLLFLISTMLVFQLIACDDDDDSNNSNNTNNVNNTQPVCGNGIIEDGEVCDGTNLGEATCVSVDATNFTGGDLACASDCKAFDTAACTNDATGQAECGNGIIEDGEVCDGTNLGDVTCETVDGTAFTGGDLACASDCASFVTDACTSDATE